MKKSILLFFTVLIFVNYSFSTEIPSKIKHVTIYKQNAKIVRATKSSVTKGSSTLVFGGLTTSLQVQSIQVGMTEGVKLLSVSYRINYLQDKKVSKGIKILQDSVKILNYKLAINKKAKDVTKGEMNVISSNTKLGSTQEGVKVEELKSLSDYYFKRMSVLQNKLVDFDKKEREIREVLSRMQNQIKQLSSGLNKSTGEIVLEVISDRAKTSDFVFSYIVNNVNWIPIYDLRSDGIDKNIQLVYKANVYQRTGLNWENVPITISTANPNINNSRPILNPRYVYFYQPTIYSKREEVVSNRNMLYEEEAISNKPMKYVDAMKIAKTKQKYVQIKQSYVPMDMHESQMNVEFKVEQPYTIPTDGKYHMVIMTEFSIPADYEYHAVPSIDKAAFLLAKIADWGKYNLLPGKANIFFENTYVGQSQINPYITADTLLLSFGRDSKIIIEREKLYKESTVKTSLTTKKHINAYEITLRNTKSEPVTIEVLDQIPLSNIKDIEVELLESGGAELVKKVGKLSWEIKLQANEKKSIKFIYSVKYPKTKFVKGS